MPKFSFYRRRRSF